MLFLVLSAGLSAPAFAEAAFSASVATDDRFRGDSTSDHRPVASLSVAYDDINGPYFGISLTGVATRDDGVQPLRSIQYVGYAKRLKSGLSLDLGITNRVYSHYYSGDYGRRFTEAYVGVIGRRVSSHIFFSPEHDGYGGASVYAEVDALLLDRGSWSVSGHAGALVPPRATRWRSRAIEGDWRLGATRRFGRTAVSLNWVGATPARYGDRRRGTVLLSASRSF
jgi:uncharacterized protein (TIGR02001 family)